MLCCILCVWEQMRKGSYSCRCWLWFPRQASRGSRGESPDTSHSSLRLYCVDKHSDREPEEQKESGVFICGQFRHQGCRAWRPESCLHLHMTQVMWLDYNRGIRILYVIMFMTCDHMWMTSCRFRVARVRRTDPPPAPRGPYHAGLGEDVPPPSVHGRAAGGVSVAGAAPPDHHGVQGVVILVLRVPASSTQQNVAQREQTSEVHTDISQGDQICERRV